MKLIGVKEQQGNYEGNNYHNYVLHVVENDVKSSIGEVATICKFKADRASDLGISKLTDWTAVLGKYIRIFYDKYRNVEAVEIIE